MDVSNANSVPISICGEIAGEPKYTMLLIGLGFRHFSMSPIYMYQVKRIVRSISIAECEKLVKNLLNFDITTDIEESLIASFKEKFPDVLI